MGEHKSIAFLALCIIVVLIVICELFLQGVSASLSISGNNFKGSSRVNLSTGLKFQNLTVENGTYAIENMRFDFAGKITVSNSSTLLIRNATLVLTTRDSVDYRDGIVLLDNSRLIAEDATIILNSTYYPEESYVRVDNDALVNITDSKLYGHVLIIGEQNSKTYINNSTLKGPKPWDLEVFAIITQDNSTARIKNSELDGIVARDNSSIYVLNSNLTAEGVHGTENGLIEIENSQVGTGQGLDDSCTLSITNSTVEAISFSGGILRVQDSRIGNDLAAYGNSTAWIRNTSVNRVYTQGKAQLWLINSPANQISTFDESQVYVGWQLPLFGTFAFPYTWLPIVQVLTVLLILSLTIALLVFVNRRWKRWQSKKKERAANAAE